MSLEKSLEGLVLTSMNRDGNGQVILEDLFRSIEIHFEEDSREPRSLRISRFLVALTNNVARLSKRLTGDENDARVLAEADIKFEGMDEEDGFQDLTNFKYLCMQDCALV